MTFVRPTGGGDDKLLRQAWNAIGDYYADRQRFQKAIAYYLQGGNQDRLAECYYATEDYKGLASLVYSAQTVHAIAGETLWL